MWVSLQRRAMWYVLSLLFAAIGVGCPMGLVEQYPCVNCGRYDLRSFDWQYCVLVDWYCVLMTLVYLVLFSTSEWAPAHECRQTVSPFWTTVPWIASPTVKTNQFRTAVNMPRVVFRNEIQGLAESLSDGSGECISTPPILSHLHVIMWGQHKSPMYKRKDTTSNVPPW